MIFSHFPGAAPLHPASKYRVVACGKCQFLKEMIILTSSSFPDMDSSHSKNWMWFFYHLGAERLRSHHGRPIRADS
jgi:hypothetical protein